MEADALSRQIPLAAVESHPKDKGFECDSFVLCPKSASSAIWRSAKERFRPRRFLKGEGRRGAEYKKREGYHGVSPMQRQELFAVDIADLHVIKKPRSIILCPLNNSADLAFKLSYRSEIVAGSRLSLCAFKIRVDFRANLILHRRDVAFVDIAILLVICVAVVTEPRSDVNAGKKKNCSSAEDRKLVGFNGEKWHFRSEKIPESVVVFDYRAENVPIPRGVPAHTESGDADGEKNQRFGQQYGEERERIHRISEQIHVYIGAHSL